MIILCAAAGGCVVPSKTGGGRFSNSSNSTLQGTFALPQQEVPPNHIQSIRLHPVGEPQLPPVVRLGSGQHLVLSFDYLGEQNQQFRVEVSHRAKTWEESTIGPSVYLDSFFQTYIQESRESFGSRPAYQHVEYEFPNNQLRPMVSGNYLLEVYSYESEELLFSTPFFISEEKGTLQTRVETLLGQRNDGRAQAQLFSTFQYPPEIEFPQFDLSMAFVQNQFWGRTRYADYLDTTTPGELNARLDRSQSFIANYEFKVLDLRNFTVDGEEIIDYRPGSTPPIVVLRRDLQHLDATPGHFTPPGFGLPVDDRSSDYARVEFSLETDTSVTRRANIYIVGQFNNWMISDLNRMKYHLEDRIWKGHALIKQGEYAYKYVMVENNSIDDLALDQGFLSSRQEYLSFVYFKDPQRNFDRLLKVDRVVAQ